MYDCTFCFLSPGYGVFVPHRKNHQEKICPPKNLGDNRGTNVDRGVKLALETEISSPATYGIVRVGAIVECKYGVVATLAKQCSAKATNC